MLQQGARSLTSLYAELSQQLKHAVCPPFRIFSGLPSKTTLPAPLPSQEYIDLAVVFLHCGKLGQCRERVCRTRGNFTGRSYFVHRPQAVNVASQFFSSNALQTLNTEVCICMRFGPARRFLIKVNAKYPEVRWTSPGFPSKPKSENLWLVLVSFRVTNLYWEWLGYSGFLPGVSGSRGRQSGRSGGLRVALNDFVKL